jgi:transposase-like protein
MSGQAKKKSNVNKNTEYFVPIKSISNGMITLDNNEKVVGVKIMPKNIFILDEDSQNNVIENLKNFYNTIDFEFWIIVADRPVDITLYLSQLQLLFNSVTKPQVRKIITDDINKGNTFINNNVVDTEYFLLFKEKNIDIIQKRIRSLINGLASCGLTSAQTTNDDLRVVLDNFLNGGNPTDFGTVIAI